MKKIREKIVFFLLLMIVMFVAVPASANAMPYTRDSHIKNAVSDYEESKSYDFVIDSYDINIKVNENNTFDITEKLEVYFHEERHGIYRTIPLSNTVTRLDGTTSKNRAVVSNLEVSENYTTSRENNMFKIQIGSEDKLVSGKQTYTIRYNYNIGKDPCEDIDELYLNIIGDEWDTMIGNITFTIKMPKKFDETKLGFSAGKTGSTESSDVWYYVDGKKIIGEYMGELNPKEALTVRCELPEGYFVNAGFPISQSTYLMVIVPAICLIISFVLWFLFGREYPMVETVEFYPPEGFNSLEMGYLYNGKASNKDVTSLLVYLANKGFIKIKEIEGKSLFNTGSDYELVEVKPYDGDNINEREFLNGMFGIKRLYSDASSGSNVDERYLPTVTQQDLYHKFYHTVDKIKRNVSTKENKKQIFKTTWPVSLAVTLMIILSLATVIAVPTFEVAGTSELRYSLCILAFYTPFFWAVSKIESVPARAIFLGFILLHSAVFILNLPVVSALKENPALLIPFFIGIACIAGSIVCLKYMSKRTKYGVELLGKIKGFKHYLETAEKEKLESMVMENPTYFYDIMPYAYVLGVSDKWIEKFENITVAPPDWYDTYGAFHVGRFGTFMHHTMKSANSVMSSKPSSNSSSGGSGGGSSGGGSGGGGGGSW